MIVRGFGCLIVICLLGTQMSCRLFHKAQTRKVPPAAVSPAPEPASAAPAPPLTAEETQPAPLPDPPVLEADSEHHIPPMPPAESSADLPPPPEEKTQAPRTATRSVTPAATSVSGEPTAAQPVEPTPVPNLTEILTEQEEWAYNREIDESLLAISQILGQLDKRPLAEEQMEVLGRVRAFTQQTTETRKVDLVTARGLARRAELLARDLETSTR